jgi:hypothetical protein
VTNLHVAQATADTPPEGVGEPGDATSRKR